MGRVLRWAIVASWLALLYLVVRPQGRDGTSPADSIVGLGGAVAAGEEWMGMYHQNQKIGYVHHTVRPDEDGYSTEEESLLRLTLLNTPQTVRLRIKGRTKRDHSLESVSFELDNGPVRFRVEGEQRGDAFHLRTVVGEEESETEMPTGGPIFLPAGIRPHLARGLSPGKRYELQVFDPSMMRQQTIVATVVGEEKVPGMDVLAWRVEEEYAGVKAVAWLDGEGRMWREEGPMGLVLVRESRDQAMHANWSDGAALDLVASVSIPVDPPLDAAELRSLRLKVGGIELDRVPTDQRQKLEGDVLTLSAEEWPVDAGFSLPYRGGEWSDSIASTPLLQSDHERIRETAARIIGDATDPVGVTARLARFVFTGLRKVPTVSVPNALQVLEMKEGDCNEHAVLFAALARAVGIPARVIAGVVYANGAFQYHAWNEVWLGRWVALDTVFDQLPADVTHIKFVSGDPEDHVAMIGVIGRLRLHVVESDRG